MKTTREKDSILWFKLLINHSLPNALSSSSPRTEAARLLFLKDLRKTFKIWLIKNLVSWSWFLENAMSRRRLTTFFDDISRTKSSIKRYSLSAIVKEDETSGVRSSLTIKVRILSITFPCVCDCWRLSRPKKTTWPQWNAWLKPHKSSSQEYSTISERMIDDSSRYFTKSFPQVRMKELQLFECQNSCELSTMSIISIWKFIWILEHRIMLIITRASRKCTFPSIDFVRPVGCLLDWTGILAECIAERGSCLLDQLCNVNSRLGSLSISGTLSNFKTCNRSAYARLFTSFLSHHISNARQKSEMSILTGLAGIIGVLTSSG